MINTPLMSGEGSDALCVGEAVEVIQGGELVWTG
jgi:hypothetical protein